MKSVWVERLVEPARDKETGNRGTRKGKSHNREGKRAGSGRSNARAKRTRQGSEPARESGPPHTNKAPHRTKRPEAGYPHQGETPVGTGGEERQAHAKSPH
jgi:hypothetical protein